jgi:hypothetical protein
MSTNLRKIAAVISLALLPQLGFASSYATVNIGAISVTLIDLNPADNILPSLTWDNSFPYGNFATAYAADSVGYYQGTTTYGEKIASFNHLLLSSSQSYAIATVSPHLDESKVNGATLSAAGYAAGSSWYGNSSSFNASAGLPYTIYSTFTLSAYTGVIFSANASLNTTTTIGYENGWGGEHAEALAKMTATGSGPTGNNGSQDSSTTLTSSADYLASYEFNTDTQTYEFVYSGVNKSESGLLGASYTNFTNLDKIGLFTVYASVSGYSYAPLVTNVPEPETYAFMLAGLAFVGFSSRRKFK